MSRTHRIGIIPAARQTAANAALDVHLPTIGPNTFSVPLFAAADDPETAAPKHYLCDWSIADDEWDEIQAITALHSAAWHEEGDPGTRVTRGRGLGRVLQVRGQRVRAEE